MSRNSKPRWLNAEKLQEAAGSSLQEKVDIEKTQPKLKTGFKQISAYICPGCHLKFTSGQLEASLRKAARQGSSFVDCPSCGTVLKETSTAQVKDPTPLINRAHYVSDSNRKPGVGRVPNTWIDKAIYGRLVQRLGTHIASLGITNPQMRFQRGIRSEKFPGEPHSAKGAEFSVEFVDRNNTRNRIFIQAGLTAKGEFIFPKTFKNTIGQEYPLTAEAIKRLGDGKLFDPVIPDMTIPPLTYRQPDMTRFREISAKNKGIQKTAQDMPMNPTTGEIMTPTPGEGDLDMKAQELGITDPADVDALKTIMRKYIDPNDPQAFDAGMSGVQQEGNFTQGLGLGIANNLNLRKLGKVVTAVQTNYENAVLEAANSGLSFDEAVTEVYASTGMPLNEEVWDRALKQLEHQYEQSPAGMEATLASELVAQAEINMVKKYRKTAQDIQDEFDFSGLTSSEVETFVDTFLNTYNDTLENGGGVANAQRQAHYAAVSQLHDQRMKTALRDEQTLVPFTDSDPDYSLAEQTIQSEPRFDHEDGPPKKYHEMDGGISDPEDRNITNMFGRATTDKMRKEGESTGIDLEPDEVGQNPINYSRYKTIVQDLLRAGNIPPTKVDMHALKDGKYTLQELKDLVQTFKVDSDAVMYPTAHASHDNDAIAKLAEEKLSDMMKEMPVKRVEDSPATAPDLGDGTDNGGDQPLSDDDIELMHEQMNESVGELDQLEGGAADNVPSAAFDAEQLVRGIKHEFEHTDDLAKAEEIAKDHLMENPDYYMDLHTLEMQETPRDVEDLHDALVNQAENLFKKEKFAADLLPLDEEVSDEEGSRIADQLGVIYNGLQERVHGNPLYLFTDPTTGSTFAATNLEDAIQSHDRMLRQFNIRASVQKTSQGEENLRPGGLVDSHGNPITPTDEPAPTEPTSLVAPPQFLSRKSPKVDVTEAVDATEQEEVLMQQIMEEKATIDALQNKVTAMQEELAQRLEPIQQELGVAGARQLKATRQLVAVMQHLNHNLIQIDNYIGYLAEVPAVKKLTAAEKVKVLLDKFGESATAALAEAENNVNAIIRVVSRYKTWPRKISADQEDQYLIALYQDTYNSLVALNEQAQEIQAALAM